ncbi:hypothetical protein V5P93_006884 [Actinokineospora auranticolor]|uniref:Uncharacterized protein n=1 Tax=Actinokineospora auranticolor TaxID=155976 RepID=A0A2S6GW72_9PSEU|nr:hypothetical protein [Actinokineospora auranticolor]PPK69474.1 hypothetical protein CLV40_10380 [Actinokineospora auranticolor]
MPFFGQVWVWSLAGFLVGAALCWLLIANPARKRATQLESELAGARERDIHRDFGPGSGAPEREYPSTALVPGFGDTRDNIEPVRRVGGGGEDSIRRGLMTLSDEDEGGLRSMPAPAVGTDDHDRDHHDDPGGPVGGHVDDDDRDGHGDDRDGRPDFRDERDDYRDDQGYRAKQDIDDDRDDRDFVPESAAETTQYTEAPEFRADDQRTQYAEAPAETTQYIAPAAAEEPERDWFGDPVDRPEGGRLVDDLDESEHEDDYYARAETRDGELDDVDEDTEAAGNRAGHLAGDSLDEADGVDYADADEEYAETGGTIFTQHTTPIPAELIREIDAQGKQERAGDHALVDDLDDDVDGHDEEPAPAERSRHSYADAEEPADDDLEEAPRHRHDVDTETDYEPVSTDVDPAPAGTATGVYDRPDLSRSAYGPDRGYGEAAAYERGDDYAAGVRQDADSQSEAPAIAAADATQFVPVVREPEPVHEPERAATNGSVEPRPQESREPAHAAAEQTEIRLPEITRPEPQEPPRQRTSITEQPGFQQPIEPTLAYGQAQPERTSNVLPKRIPSKPQNRFPFGVQTATQPVVSTQSAPAATATAAMPAQAQAQKAGDRERSLFEPIRPADEVAESKPTPPPPHRLRGARTLQQSPTGVDPFVPPGPFGPGSAMPLPGGLSPSSEYTIKASVTALRYCAPDSPKFDRTVAEVWFRSVADAERVGFRPLQ